MACGRSILGKHGMAVSSATFHEASEKLGAEAIDRHRAIASIVEELEAFDSQHILSQATPAY